MGNPIRGMQPLTSFNSIATAIALGVVATSALADDTSLTTVTCARKCRGT